MFIQRSIHSSLIRLTRESRIAMETRGLYALREALMKRGGPNGRTAELFSNRPATCEGWDVQDVLRLFVGVQEI